MTLQQLKYAITTAEQGSISEAAKVCFVSQPTLSNALRDLENELEFQIFHRTNKGIHITEEGTEFLGYARQVKEQSDLLEERYLHGNPRKQRFSVSTQHYSFAVNAFVELIKRYGIDEYDFTLRETRTHDIIEDVKLLRSEIGILYLNHFNRSVILKLLGESDLIFTPLFTAKPHVFISTGNPLASLHEVTLEQLAPFPCLTFEQGTYNSFYFSEEILSTLEHAKNIRVSDRATLFNLLIGLNGYTISSGVLDAELNGRDIVAVPLKIEDTMEVGTIMRKDMIPSELGRLYLEALHLYAN